jgi:hypothetical protein
MKHRITIELYDDDCEELERLAEHSPRVPGPDGFRSPIQRVLEFAASRIAAGVRRSDSWEAAAVAALFGE